jgi:hypothetical protein
MTLEEMLAAAGITEMEIMEYADGVLAPERRPIVRADLAKYPELMQLLELFIFTRGPLKDVYDEVLKAPIPEALLDPLLPRVAPPAPRRGKLGVFIDTWFGCPARTAFALAAMSAVVLAAWLLLSRPAGYDFATFGERGFVASPELQRALDTTPMGKSTPIGRGLSVVPQLTFATRQKIWCREISLMFGASKQSAALACRGDDGDWRVKVTTEAERVHTSPNEHQPASRENEILDGARSGIKDDDVLSAEAELDVIGGGWKRRP